MKIITKEGPPPAASPLEALADKAQDLIEGQAQGDGDGEGDPSQQVLEEQAAKSMAMLEAGVSKVLLAFLKVGRTWAAKRLPELRDEWTDEMLQEPAAAAVPLIKKHLSFLMSVVGQSPEAAALAISLLPLAMGYIAALDKHEEAAKNGTRLPASGPAVLKAVAVDGPGE